MGSNQVTGAGGGYTSFSLAVRGPRLFGPPSLRLGWWYVGGSVLEILLFFVFCPLLL